MIMLSNLLVWIVLVEVITCTHNTYPTGFVNMHPSGPGNLAAGTHQRHTDNLVCNHVTQKFGVNQWMDGPVLQHKYILVLVHFLGNLLHLHKQLWPWECLLLHHVTAASCSWNVAGGSLAVEKG